jgi:NAD(P)-dependent dehydrogenase (short-subunit alcohol dehydrogenase family)
MHRKKVLLFGGNGRIGNIILNDLSNEFSVTNVDTSKESASPCQKYVQYKNLNDLNKIYKNQDFYAVIHCQQLKPKGFMDLNFSSIKLSDFEKIMEINLKLSFISAQKYVKRCEKRKGNYPGRLINFVSTYSIISSNPSLYDGTEMGNPAHYTISKAGLWGLTKYIAANFRDLNVLCNSISPHGVENKQSKEFKKTFSKRSPLSRLSEPSEILPAVNFLLDENNTYTNGANIPIDGGWTSC